MTISLSVLIPCYNEGTTIGLMIQQVAQQTPWVKQIVVTNDGSTDLTRSVLDRLVTEWKVPGVKIAVRHLDHNQGKGAAVRAALELASEPYVLIQDADLELDPANYPSLAKPIETGVAEVVFGDRFPNGFPPALRIPSRVANWVVTRLSNWMFGLRLKDQACGYKLMPTELARSLQLRTNGFEICSEMTAKLGLRKYDIRSVPVRYIPRDELQGKKIRWIDGFIGVYTLFYYRLFGQSRRTP